MAKYQNEVKELLEAIGGKENISAVSHCMTRMRFVLADEKKADEAHRANPLREGNLYPGGTVPGDHRKRRVHIFTTSLPRMRASRA